MTQLQVFILSMIQGLAEFLPISSSAHLILLSKFTHFPDQGVELDVAVHIGSVFAVLIYFYKDVWAVIKDAIESKFLPNLKTYGNKLFWLTMVGTLPAIVVGLVLYYTDSSWTRSTKIIGWNIIIFGLILLYADVKLRSIRKINDLRIVDAVLIGLAQAAAMIPGTSRSGITITMARFLGIERREAAKFSMLLSVPAILGAGIISAIEICKRDNLQDVVYAISGIGYSFVASILVIFFMMEWLKKFSFLPFVIYRVSLGIFLLLYSYGLILN